MDETVVNGAQIFYKEAFGIGTKSERDTWLVGLVNGAPYLCCAVLGCWLTDPMNRAFGRRGTIFISCLVSALACFWQAFTNTWWHMFIARFVLGLGIGPKSATTPVFAAECSPPKLRGALVMVSTVPPALPDRKNTQSANPPPRSNGKCGLPSVSWSAISLTWPSTSSPIAASS